MVTPRQYTTATARRTALEARLLERAKRDNTDLQRLRRQVASDRLLTRLFSTDAAVRGIPGRYRLSARQCLEPDTLGIRRQCTDARAPNPPWRWK
jgi:hypothetical protein